MRNKIILARLSLVLSIGAALISSACRQPQKSPDVIRIRSAEDTWKLIIDALDEGDLALLETYCTKSGVNDLLHTHSGAKLESYAIKQMATTWRNLPMVMEEGSARRKSYRLGYQNERAQKTSFVLEGDEWKLDRWFPGF